MQKNPMGIVISSFSNDSSDSLLHACGTNFRPSAFVYVRQVGFDGFEVLLRLDFFDELENVFFLWLLGNRKFFHSLCALIITMYINMIIP